MSSENLAKLKISLESKPSKRGRIPLQRIILFSLLTLALLTTGIYWLWIYWLRPPLDVHMVKASITFPSRALTILNASGYVVAQRKAAVSSKATGRIEHLYVEEGSFVKQGNVVAQLENSDLEAAVDEAKASLSVSRADLNNADAELDDATLNFNRQKVLKESGSVSEQAFDSAEARYKKAKAAYRSAKFRVDKAEAAVKVSEVNLDQSYIRAPFDGVILTKSAEEGEVVAPMGASLNAKASVVSMADMKSLMVEVDVAESSLEKVKIGGPAEIRLDAFPNDRFEGKVYMIVPTADRSKATVLAKIKFDIVSEKVLPEMSAKVSFLSRALKKGENKPFLGVPTNSILKEDSSFIVYRVKDSLAQANSIETGRSWGETTEILSGLKEGDTIVMKPDSRLNDGRRVKIKE
ncbi:MAG: efflux RND transporter periplasmic adaptor subunit [Deltaproteobacteria bacterium]|nr:efflux RND transporter periplasmic adaptor subunit [Deltaproteobacteria bacterium]